MAPISRVVTLFILGIGNIIKDNTSTISVRKLFSVLGFVIENHFHILWTKLCDSDRVPLDDDTDDIQEYFEQNMRVCEWFYSDRIRCFHFMGVFENVNNWFSREGLLCIFIRFCILFTIFSANALHDYCPASIDIYEVTYSFSEQIEQ